MSISDHNRLIIQQAYDDGNGHCVTLVPTDDCPWFAGMWEDFEVMIGMEHNGMLYSIVAISGSGLVSVIVGRGLIDNEIGIVFPNSAEAKTYVKGLTEK